MVKIQMALRLRGGKTMRFRAVTTRLAALLLFAVGLFACLSTGLAQSGFNEREVKAEPSGSDAIWAFDFRFKDPRIITVNIPGRGQRNCWYMWYQVINRTGKPQPFVPD